MHGQRVRVSSTGECGTVLERAVLCIEKDGQIVQRPACDAKGKLVLTAPEQQHLLLLDEHGEQLGSPLDVEPWPQVGQCVRWMLDADDELNFPNEIATVTEFAGIQDDGGSVPQPVYTVTRTVYASRPQVQCCVPGHRSRALCVGDWVQLTDSHRDANLFADIPDVAFRPVSYTHLTLPTICSV